MLTIGEFIKHQGEWDIDNHLSETIHQFINTIKSRLTENISIKEVCKDVQIQVIMLRQSMLQWFSSRPQKEITEFVNNMKSTDLESKDFPELARLTTLCIQLFSSISEKNWSPNGIQDLINNPKYANKLQKIKGEANQQMFVNSSLIASFHFETCCIIADLIINKEITKSKEWVSELIDYLQITFVINIAIGMQWGIFNIDKDIIKNTPILNRAKILKSDIAMFGVQNISHLIA